MRVLIGGVLMLAGLALSAYAGIWLAFIGGIMDVVEAIRATELVALDLAIGVAKVVFSGWVFYLTAMLLVFPGYAIVMND